MACLRRPLGRCIENWPNQSRRKHHSQIVSGWKKLLLLIASILLYFPSSYSFFRVFPDWVQAHPSVKYTLFLSNNTLVPGMRFRPTCSSTCLQRFSRFHLTSTVTVGMFPTMSIYDPVNGNIYVTNYYSGLVSIISGTTNKVIGNVTVLTAYGVAYDQSNRNLYAVSSNRRTLQLLTDQAMPLAV